MVNNQKIHLKWPELWWVKIPHFQTQDPDPLFIGDFSSPFWGWWNPMNIMNIPFLLVIPLNLHEDPICRRSISLSLASTFFVADSRRGISGAEKYDQSRSAYQAIVVPYCTTFSPIIRLGMPPWPAGLRHHHSAGSSRPGGPRLQSLRRGRADAQIGRRARGWRRVMTLRWGKSWENGVNSHKLATFESCFNRSHWVRMTGDGWTEVLVMNHLPARTHFHIEVTIRRIWYWWMGFQPLGEKGFDHQKQWWSWYW